MRHGPTGKILALNVDISVLEQLDGNVAPCCPISWHSRRCPRVARSSGSAETRAATQAQEETEFIRLLWLEIVQGNKEDNIIDQEISRGLTRQVFLTQSTEADPQLFPLKIRDRRRKVLP